MLRCIQDFRDLTFFVVSSLQRVTRIQAMCTQMTRRSLWFVYVSVYVYVCWCLIGKFGSVDVSRVRGGATRVNEKRLYCENVWAGCTERSVAFRRFRVVVATRRASSVAVRRVEGRETESLREYAAASITLLVRLVPRGFY